MSEIVRLSWNKWKQWRQTKSKNSHRLFRYNKKAQDVSLQQWGQAVYVQWWILLDGLCRGAFHLMWEPRRNSFLSPSHQCQRYHRLQGRSTMGGGCHDARSNQGNQTAQSGANLPFADLLHELWWSTVFAEWPLCLCASVAKGDKNSTLMRWWCVLMIITHNKRLLISIVDMTSNIYK